MTVNLERRSFWKLTLLGLLTPAAGTLAVNSTQAADEEGVVDESLGAVLAAYLYQSNMTIGILGDAVVKEVYDVKTGGQILDLTLNFLKAVEEALDKIIEKEALEAEDLTFVKNASAICDLLKEQGEALRSFWKTEKPEFAKKFSDIRNGCSKKIDKLLGIK